MREFTGKMTRPETGTTVLCEPALSTDVPEVYARILGKNAAPQDRDNCFVRASAVETHMDKSQEPILCENLQGKKPDNRLSTLIKHRP
jgi:hypothetical protein